MIGSRTVLSLAALAALASAARPADNPQVKLLHEQIAALKAEEKATLKTIHAWYGSFIKRDKFTAEVIKEERAVLLRQEESLLAVTPSAEGRKDIQAHYDSVREFLREDVKLDAAAVKRLRELEKAHEAHVGNAYKAKVAQLEAAANLLKSKK